MLTDSAQITRASRPIIGTIIGVGILSLPYAVMQLGFVLGVIALCFVAFMSWIVMQLYTDLVLVRGGHARFIRVISRELGHQGTIIAAIAFVGSLYGALIAYVIFGGQFLRTVLFSVAPMSVFSASVLFFLFASALTVGGMLFIAKVQKVLLPIFFLLLAALVVVTFPHIRLENFSGFTPENLGIALGVFVFAFHGMSAIPEARDLLGRTQNLLPRAVTRSNIVTVLVYLVFVVTILGVTGVATTENAIVGLGWTLGHSVTVVASLIALIVATSAYMNVATALINTYTFDFRIRIVLAWVLTVSVPLVAFLLGASQIVPVLSFTGGILGSITGIVMLLAYERARMSAELPKRSLRVPQVVVGLAFCMFVMIFVMTVIG